MAAGLEMARDRGISCKTAARLLRVSEFTARKLWTWGLIRGHDESRATGVRLEEDSVRRYRMRLWGAP
jgi:hypothetical protein